MKAHREVWDSLPLVHTGVFCCARLCWSTFIRTSAAPETSDQVVHSLERICSSRILLLPGHNESLLASGATALLGCPCQYQCGGKKHKCRGGSPVPVVMGCQYSICSGGNPRLPLSTKLLGVDTGDTWSCGATRLGCGSQRGDSYGMWTPAGASMGCPWAPHFFCSGQCLCWPPGRPLLPPYLYCHLWPGLLVCCAYPRLRRVPGRCPGGAEADDGGHYSAQSATGETTIIKVISFVRQTKGWENLGEVLLLLRVWPSKNQGNVCVSVE